MQSSESIACTKCDRIFTVDTYGGAFDQRQRVPDNGEWIGDTIQHYDGVEATGYLCEKCLETFRDGTFGLMVSDGTRTVLLRFAEGLVIMPGQDVFTEYVPFLKALMNETPDEFEDWIKLYSETDGVLLSMSRRPKPAEMGLPYVLGFADLVYVCLYVKQQDEQLWKEYLNNG